MVLPLLDRDGADALLRHQPRASRSWWKRPTEHFPRDVALDGRHQPAVERLGGRKASPGPQSRPPAPSQRVFRGRGGEGRDSSRARAIAAPLDRAAERAAVDGHRLGALVP